MIPTARLGPDKTFRFPLLAAVSAVHDGPALRDLVESFLSPLRAIGGEAWEPGAGAAAAPSVVFVATGGTERRIVDSVMPGAREPVLLVAHAGHNSLPAALEALARLQQQGVRARIQYLRGAEDADGWRQVARAVGDLAVRRALSDSRIGLVGEPSDWLVASRPAPATVREVWGPTVVPLPLEPLLAEPGPETATRGDPVARDFRDRAEGAVELQESDLLAAGAVYARLREIVEAERLDAVAVRCFDLVTRRRTTGCLALARLNEEGVVAGCEGDLVATVGMLWLQRMLHAIPWMANPSRVDADRNVLTLAHCTAARGSGQTYRLRTHFESGLGVAIQSLLPAGPVTLVRIGGERMDVLRALDGDLLRNTDHPDLCRTQVEVEVDRDALREILARPLGNHMLMVPGHHAADLIRWHETMIG